MARFAGLLLLIAGAARAFQPASLRSSALAAPQPRDQLHRISVMMSKQSAVEFQQRNKWPSVFGTLKATGRRAAAALFAFLFFRFSEAGIILRAFEEGRGWGSFEREETVDRKDLVDILGRILQPHWGSKTYGVIVGVKGTGKTTAIKQALAALKSPKGAVYFDCGPFTPSKFSRSLASLIGVRRQLDSNEAIFDKLEQPLKDAAAKFKAKYGRPMVLVIDSCDYLAKQCEPFLGTLQDFAKKCADYGNLRFVFISSDSTTLSSMMARGSWSRAGEPFEIAEIPDEQAMEYLVKKGVPEDRAKLAVANLTGGLINSLQNFALAISSGKTYEQVAKRLDIKLNTKVMLLEEQFPVNHPLFQYMVEHKSIGTDVAHEIVGIDQVYQLDNLLERNILAEHPDETYTFHDRHTATWFSRELVSNVVSTLATGSEGEVLP